MVRRISQPGLGGSGVLWSSLDAANAEEVIAAEVRFFGDRRERFEWKLYSYDAADLPDRLTAAGFEPEEPESLMIAAIDEIIDALRAAELPPRSRSTGRPRGRRRPADSMCTSSSSARTESELRASLRSSSPSARDHRHRHRRGRRRAGQRCENRLPSRNAIRRAMGRRHGAAVASPRHLPGPRQTPGRTGGRAGYSYLTVDASDQSRYSGADRLRMPGRYNALYLVA